MAATYLIGLGDLYTAVAADNDGLPALWATQDPEGTGAPAAIIEHQSTRPEYTRKGIAFWTVKAKLAFWVVGFNLAELLAAALMAALTVESVHVDDMQALTFIMDYRLSREPQRGKTGEYIFAAEIEVEAKIEPHAA